MENFNVLITFLSGLGFGSVITIIVKHSLEQKSKLKEMWLMDYKQACDGLLDAYRENALNHSKESRNKFAYYELKMKLYANEEVIEAISKFKNCVPSSEEQKMSEKDIIIAMRNDLGLA